MTDDVKRAGLALRLARIVQGLEEDSSESIRALTRAGLDVIGLVLEKNKAYGDSMRSPVAVFAQGIDPRTRIGVRMDDKISRIMRGDVEAFEESPDLDLAGYLIGRLSLDLGDPEAVPEPVAPEVPADPPVCRCSAPAEYRHKWHAPVNYNRGLYSCGTCLGRIDDARTTDLPWDEAPAGTWIPVDRAPIV